MSRLVRMPTWLSICCALLIGYGVGCSLLTDGVLSDKPPEATPAGTGSGGQGGTMGAGGSGGASCKLEPPPPGGSCPSICSDCSDNICLIDASADNAFEQMPITCPEGFACDVRCAGNRSCAESTISCPESYACSVTCSDVRSCEAAIINCSTGVCALDCASGANTCQDAQLNCGSKACMSTCGNGQIFPEIDCDPACYCDEC